MIVQQAVNQHLINDAMLNPIWYW